jgi:hypothetical protein
MYLQSHAVNGYRANAGDFWGETTGFRTGEANFWSLVTEALSVCVLGGGRGRNSHSVSRVSGMVIKKCR